MYYSRITYIIKSCLITLKCCLKNWSYQLVLVSLVFLPVPSSYLCLFLVLTQHFLSHSHSSLCFLFSFIFLFCFQRNTFRRKRSPFYHLIQVSVVIVLFIILVHPSPSLSVEHLQKGHSPFYDLIQAAVLISLSLSFLLSFSVIFLIFISLSRFLS